MWVGETGIKIRLLIQAIIELCSQHCVRQRGWESAIVRSTDGMHAARLPLKGDMEDSEDLSRENEILHLSQPTVVLL